MKSLLLYMEHDWNEARKRKDMAWFERNIADEGNVAVITGINRLRGATRRASRSTVALG